MNTYTHQKDSNAPRRAFWFPALFLAFTLVTLPLATPAQEPEKETEGINQGNYNIKQTFEVGYRFTSFSGNLATYRTFVYLREGPRLLEHSLEMRSLNHQGWLFDNFSLRSFGYGGDPNAVSRMRAYKNKWYNFNATWRMNRNAWDYNLLANPLNPPQSNPSFPITYALHKMDLVRRMSDYSLTLAPQSPLRLRVGYSRSIMEGPSFTNSRAGTETLFYQPWKTSTNSYSFGVDFKFIPKTSISYDQFFNHFKNDTSWVDPINQSILGLPVFTAQLSNGRPVNLGVIYNAGFTGSANQPCATPISSAGPPRIANSTCNAFLDYTRVGRVRSLFPTEQISFQSNYFPNVDLSGRFSYSSGDSDVPDFSEVFEGLYSRTRARAFHYSGASTAKRVAVNADAAATIHVTDKLTIQDTFRFSHFRLPSFFDLQECYLFYGASVDMLQNALVFAGTVPMPANCTAAFTNVTKAAGTPTHGTSSSADIANEQISRFLGQDMKFNQVEVLFDFTRRYGARVGHRFARRSITEGIFEEGSFVYYPTVSNRGNCSVTANCTLLADGSRTFSGVLDDETFGERIDENSLLVGLWARPTDQIRLSFDSEFFYADHAFVRIAPRQMQRFKFRGSYAPRDWMTFGAVMNILEKRNNVAEIFHRQHYRTFGFSGMFNRGENFALDVGYEYNDIFSTTNICFTLPGTMLPPGSSPCPVTTPAATTSGISIYENKLHYGYFGTMWRPVKRVTSRFGYTLSSTSGDTLILSPVAPPGTLSYNYHQPYIGLDVDLTHGVTGKAYWGYYGYNEKTPAGTFTPARDFRGNLVTLSMRYAF